MKLVLLFAAAMVSGAWAFAAQSVLPASTTLSMRGTIQKYDPATRTLSLSTPNAPVRFRLVSAVRIRHGWQTIAASDLENLSGYRAIVRYSESGANKIVESIHVFGKGEPS